MRNTIRLGTVFGIGLKLDYSWFIFNRSRRADVLAAAGISLGVYLMASAA